MMSSLTASLPFLLLILCPSARAQTPVPGRTEFVGGNIVDFGAVEPGTVEGAIRVVNTGEGMLRFRDMIESCPCLYIWKNTDSLPPGDTATLGIRFDVSSKPYGSVSQPVILVTDDSSAPERVFYVVAFVRPDYVVGRIDGDHALPQTMIMIPDGVPGQQHVDTIHFVNTGDRTLRILSTTIEYANFSILHRSPIPVSILPGEQTDIVLGIIPTGNSLPSSDLDPPGTILGTIRILTSGRHNPSVRVGVYGNLKP